MTETRRSFPAGMGWGPAWTGLLALALALLTSAGMLLVGKQATAATSTIHDGDALVNAIRAGQQNIALAPCARAQRTGAIDELPTTLVSGNS